MFKKKKTATDLIQKASKLINLALDNYTSANSCLALIKYDEASENYSKAIEHYNKAIHYLKQALEIEPSNLCALQSKGDAFIGIGDALRNKKCVENALAKENITDEDVLKPYKCAIEECYNKVLNIDPRNGRALEGIGAALEGQGKYEEASKCYYAPCSRMSLTTHETDPQQKKKDASPPQSLTLRLFKPSPHFTLPSKDDTASDEEDSRTNSLGSQK